MRCRRGVNLRLWGQMAGAEGDFRSWNGIVLYDLTICDLLQLLVCLFFFLGGYAGTEGLLKRSVRVGWQGN